MSSINTFINHKSKQLVFFVRGFLSYKIPYTELDLYFWDTMEEWSQIKKSKHQAYEKNEHVFWHVLHQIHYWPQDTLLKDNFLRGELETCLDCLENQEKYPLSLDCIGIRP